MWTFRTIILPLELADQARNLCMALTGSASEGMFSTPVYTDGVHTHTISSGYIAGEFADLLPCGDSPGNQAALLAMLEGVEFPIAPEELAGMLAMIDISEESADEAMARLGLALVQPDSPKLQPSLDE